MALSPTGLLAAGGSGQDRFAAARAARQAAREARQAAGGIAPPPVTTPPPAGGSSGTPPPQPSGPGYTVPDIGPAPTAADSSVETSLNGLLNSNSPYMAQAREAGQRMAQTRGLLNSSIAGGNSEAAAIAAAAPMASQDASQTHQHNMEVLQAYDQLRQGTTLQSMSDSGALARQNSEDTATMSRTQAQLDNAVRLQQMGDTSAMARLVQQGSIETSIAKLNNASQMSQQEVQSNVSLISNYMNSLAAIAQNPDIPADARNMYMAELLRVQQQTSSLNLALGGQTVSWPTTPAPGAPGPGTGTGGGSSSGGYNGPTKSQIIAMQHDGTPGNYQQAVAAWNAAHPSDQITTSGSSGSSTASTVGNAMFGITGLLAKPFG